ncbi:MAG: hypothetical protein V4667_09595 [Bacteroidota bacterium]
MTEQIATATLVNKDYIELTFLRENITLDVNEVKEGWSKAQKLSPDKKTAVLLKTGKWTLLENEARNYVMNEFKTWPCVAIVVDNLGQRLMGQVVINLTGKSNQIKLFENELKAKEWLINKISKNKFEDRT